MTSFGIGFGRPQPCPGSSESRPRASGCGRLHPFLRPFSWLRKASAHAEMDTTSRRPHRRENTNAWWKGGGIRHSVRTMNLCAVYRASMNTTPRIFNLVLLHEVYEVLRDDSVPRPSQQQRRSLKKEASIRKHQLGINIINRTWRTYRRYDASYLPVSKNVYNTFSLGIFIAKWRR